MKYKKILLSMLLFFGITATASVFLIYYYIENANNQLIKPIADLPEADTIIVFGALVYSDEMVSEVLAKRLDVGIEAYQAGKASTIIVSGDHGQNEYDEVTAMKNYLVSKGIPREAIFMDHAGFNTYDSLYRARDVFEVKKAILVTQKIHLKRALFIAKCLDLEVTGAVAIPNQSDAKIQRVREIGARTKAFLQAVIFKPEPRFLGEKIPVLSSSGLATE